MKHDSRLSGLLHVLLHMAERDGPATSDDLARIMRTNPVVIRRIMAGLRERGLVISAKGHGGGWTLARDPAAITLRDLHDALGSPDFFAVAHRQQHPACRVEQAVNATLEAGFAQAEALLLAHFETITLAIIRREFSGCRPGQTSTRERCA